MANNSRIKLTDKELILDPAFSKKSELNVQQTEAPKPAISPICDRNILYLVYNLRTEVFLIGKFMQI